MRSFGTPKDLFDAYWDRKRRDCRQRRQPPVRFGEVIGVLADAMSARQRLSVPVSVLDDRDLLDDADVLASEHVLVRDGRRLAFFHEAFFDYAFARRWVGRGQTLVQFLLEGEQELPTMPVRPEQLRPPRSERIKHLRQRPDRDGDDNGVPAAEVGEDRNAGDDFDLVNDITGSTGSPRWVRIPTTRWGSAR